MPRIPYLDLSEASPEYRDMLKGRYDLNLYRMLPHATTIVLHAPRADDLPQDHPARAKAASVGGAAAFVCRRQSCSLPVTTAKGLIDLVAQR